MVPAKCRCFHLWFPDESYAWRSWCFSFSIPAGRYTIVWISWNNSLPVIQLLFYCIACIRGSITISRFQEKKYGLSSYHFVEIQHQFLGRPNSWNPPWDFVLLLKYSGNILPLFDSLLCVLQVEVNIMSFRASGGLWRHLTWRPTWPPSWIFIRIRIYHETAKTENVSRYQVGYDNIENVADFCQIFH